MRGGVAVMLGLFALAAAVAFQGLAARYQLFATTPIGETVHHTGGTAWRTDRLTGEVCLVRLFAEPPSVGDCAR